RLRPRHRARQHPGRGRPHPHAPGPADARQRSGRRLKKRGRLSAPLALVRPWEDNRMEDQMSVIETAANTQATQKITGVVPYITMPDANAASAFYQKAFGAIEVMRMPAEDGKRLTHCHLHINGGAFMFNDGFPEAGHPASPLGSIAMMLNVDDID